MNTVGIDMRMIQKTGIGTYLRGLLSGIQRIYGFRRYAFLGFGSGPQSLLGPAQTIPFTADIYSIQEQLQYHRLLKQCRLWHAPHYNIPFFKGRTKLVVTVHDLIHWIFRKDFFSPLQALYAGTMFRRTVQTADHIIAVSNSTRQDLIQYFKAAPEKITVIYEGVQPNFPKFASFDELDRTFRQFKLPASFFLYVGSLKPHKNILFMTELFRSLKQATKIQADLVVVGGKDARYRSGSEGLRDFASGGGVHYLPQVTADQLAHLYQGAMALVHPSLYEGFGLTLLEAMACGTPVISSHAASLPEVAGEAAVLFDPKNAEDLAAALIRVEKSESLRRKLRENGFIQLKKFSWDETARQTLNVYDRVLSS